MKWSSKACNLLGMDSVNWSSYPPSPFPILVGNHSMNWPLQTFLIWSECNEENGIHSELNGSQIPILFEIFGSSFVGWCYEITGCRRLYCPWWRRRVSVCVPLLPSPPRQHLNEQITAPNNVAVEKRRWREQFHRNFIWISAPKSIKYGQETSRRRGEMASIIRP